MILIFIILLIGIIGIIIYYTIGNSVKSRSVKESQQVKTNLVSTKNSTNNGAFENEPYNSVISLAKKNGQSETLVALQTLNSQTIKVFDFSRKLSDRDQIFEFELFAFSYYLLYVENNHLNKYADFYDDVINFYSNVALWIVNRDPSEIYLKIVLSKDKFSFLIEKIQAFQHEIRNLKLNDGYYSKYTFLSFYMYSLCDVEGIRENSDKVIESNIVNFRNELSIVLVMLELNARKILNFEKKSLL